MDKFEEGLVLKLRFNYNGIITIEDLYDLNKIQLNLIFKELNKQLQTDFEESLIEETSIEKKILELKISIIKHIVNYKNELDSKKKKEETIKSLKALQKQKKEQELLNKSHEELESMIKELEG